MKNSIKQLLRRPGFLISFVLLLTLSCAFFCLSAGLWANARQSMREAEGVFTTIAVLNDAEFRPMRSNDQKPKYAPELLERVKESGAVSQYTLMADARQSLTGYSENLYGVMISDRKNTGSQIRPSFTTPYAPSVLVVKCMEVAKKPKGDLGTQNDMAYTATFLIDHGASPAIHPGYSDIHTLKMDSTCYFSLGNPIFQEGKTYLLYTPDMEIRSKKTGLFTEVEAGDGTAYALFDYLNVKVETGAYGLYGDDWPETGYFDFDLYEYDAETDSIHGQWRGIDSFNDGYSVIEIMQDGALPTMPFVELTEGMGAEDVLNSQYGEMWERIIRRCLVSHHSFQIFRTNSLDSLLPFNQLKVSLVAGRGFTQDEYMSGERVCVVSSEFAQANGLEVGDTVTTELFNAGYQYNAYYTGDTFYPGRYKYGMELSTPYGFKIVGIYSSPGWEQDYYSFTPNTVFVPFNSIDGEYPGPTPLWEGGGIENQIAPERPGMFSLKLKNGSVKSFEAGMEALGYGGMYYYFDQGYSGVEGTLNGMNRNAALLMGICGLVWAAATALFMVLYIGRIRKDLGIMASLGAGRRRMFIHTAAALAVTALVSAALGGAAGYAIYNAASDAAYEYAREQGKSNLMFSDLPAKSNLAGALMGEGGRSEDISAINLADTFNMKKSPESVWYAAAGQCAAIIGASAIAAAVLCRKKPVELASGFNPVDKGRGTGGAKEAVNMIKANEASKTSFGHAGENRANSVKAKNNSIKCGGIRMRFALKYALKRMSRSSLGCLALLFVSAAFALLLCELNFSLANRMDGLDGLYKNIEVKCVVSDLTGTKIDGLELSTTYIDVCTSEYYTLWEHVKDISLKRSLRYATEGSDEVERIKSDYYSTEKFLVGITRPGAEPALAQEIGVKITYFEGFDETIFLTNNDVCIVPADMMDIVVDGKLKMTAVDHIMNDEYGTADREFTVAGAYTGGSGTVYCPWETVCGIIRGVGGNIYTESLSFTVEDNYRLEEFKKKAAQYFTSANLSPGETIYSFALTVYDRILIESTTAVRGEIRLLEILIPVLLALSAGIGFVAGFLYIRNRKQEFAVMRSLGTGKRQVFMASFFEQFILVTAGTLLGMCLYMLIRGTSVAPNYMNLLIYLLCYLLGAAIAVIRITRVNVMEIMRIDE